MQCFGNYLQFSPSKIYPYWQTWHANGLLESLNKQFESYAKILV